MLSSYRPRCVISTQIRLQSIFAVDLVVTVDRCFADLCAAAQDRYLWRRPSIDARTMTVQDFGVLNYLDRGFEKGARCFTARPAALALDLALAVRVVDMVAVT
jgi:hypothetical protein